MTMSDPIADMLTRIRNANTAKHDTVDVPASKMKVAIADILVNEGYIVKYDLIDEGSFKTIRITLKYGADKNEKVITGLKRISKPGLRVYAGKEDLPKVLGGLGTAIISTNQGVVTDKEARKLGAGGYRQSCRSFLQSCDPLLKDSLGRVCQTPVNVACCLKTEPVLCVLAVVKYIRGCLVNRNRPCVCCRVCLLLSHMKL